MDYFEYIRHENGRVPLITKVDAAKRRVCTLEQKMEQDPTEDDYDELMAARDELQAAREELRAYDAPSAQGMVFKDATGLKFDPHVPRQPKWMADRKVR